MGAKSRFGYFFASAVATQFLLGCQPGEKEEELTALPAVSVPAELEHPAELVGNWQEAKGKQTVQLNADGTGEFTSKITLGADVTKGAPQSFDQKTSTKWGVKDKTFYFTEIKGSGPLKYDWEMSDGKIKLSNSGSKLSYSRVADKTKK